MIVYSWHLKLSERQYFQFSCIFTFDGAFRVLYKKWLPLHSDVFLLSATDLLLKFGWNDFTCSPPVFGLLVDYFSTLNWRWVFLLLYFVTTLLILSVAKVSRVSFENDESIDPNTSWSDEFLCSGLVLWTMLNDVCWKWLKYRSKHLMIGWIFVFSFSVVRRPFPDFWIRFYQWLYSIFDGIWKAVPCFFRGIFSCDDAIVFELIVILSFLLTWLHFSVLPIYALILLRKSFMWNTFDFALVFVFFSIFS